MDLDVSGVDDSNLAAIVGLDSGLKHPLKHTFLCPSKVESINAVPFSAAFGQLIPLCPGDHDPPNPTESFEKISQRTPSFQNVRLALLRIKLIFLRACKARPASLLHSLSKQ